MVLHPVDKEITDSLDAFHPQFWSSVKGDDKALSAFLSAWKTFTEDKFDRVADYLQNDTLQKVYSFSDMVASVVQGLVDALSLSNGIYEEVPKFLEENGSSDERKNSLPPYLKIAFQWLVANLHNPYPSSEARESMASQTGSSRKDVDNWFLDARKRIGWNGMRRKHFNNKQVNIVDAAKRFFLNTDPTRPLPHIVESDFASVQVRAQELYSDKFEESPLVTRLNMSTIETKTSLEAKVGGNGSRKGRASPATEAARHYPSPQPSPGRSCQSLSSSPSPSFSEVPPTTSKRKSSVLLEVEEDKRRLSKRQRPCEVGRSRSPSPELRRPTLASPEISLPSPVSSTFDQIELQPPPHYTHLDVSHKRKRRLSDLEGLPSPKRPRTSPVVSPQLRTVSNPLPMSQPTADEFNWDQLLDFSTLPPPVCFLSPEDITGPVDVSLFEFPSWEQYGCSSFGLSPSEEPIIASSPSNTLNTGAIDDFPIHSTDPLAEDFPLFNWNAYSPSDPECPVGALSTKASGLYTLPNISSDFAPLPDQWAVPISLSEANGCFPTFTVPTLSTPEEVLAQAMPEPAATLSQSEREAKEERLRALKAEMATLTAEIAASK